jgi:GAF domain-containing protein
MGNYKYIEQNIKKYIDEFKLGHQGELSDLLRSICEILVAEFEYFDWVGFYLVAGGDTLVLGPYVGDSTDHTEIKFGVGVCGTVAQNQQTMVVPDVNAIDNYLSCSVSVQSEIVIPIFDTAGKFVAQLDIDSHIVDPFTTEDVRMLERICEWLSECF